MEKMVKVYWDHDGGWTDDDYGNPDLCGPWHEIPDELFQKYLDARSHVISLEAQINIHIKRKGP